MEQQIFICICWIRRRLIEQVTDEDFSFSRLNVFFSLQKDQFILEVLLVLVKIFSVLVSVSSLICIFHSLSLLGNHQGEILLFSVPQKGTNIFLKETIPGKQQTHFQCIENGRLLFSF